MIDLLDTLERHLGHKARSHKLLSVHRTFLLETGLGRLAGHTVVSRLLRRQVRESFVDVDRVVELEGKPAEQG